MKGALKKVIALIPILILAVGMTATSLFGANATQNAEAYAEVLCGVTGDCTWELDNEGTLLICGNGKTGDYPEGEGNGQWKTAGIKKVILKEGVTGIGSNAFLDLSELSSVTVPNSMISIGACAFKNTNLSNIVLLENVTEIETDAFENRSEKFMIYGRKSSFAQDYAQTNDIPFKVFVCFCPHCDSVLSEDDIITDNGRPAACTLDGLTDGSRCSVCGEIIVPQETIPATGHSATLDEGFPATCTHEGLTDGSRCSVCGEIIVPQETIPATGHSATLDEGFPASCTRDGLTDGSHCSVCGEIIVPQETIPATGHTVIEDEGFPATCTLDGLTDGSHCSVCGEIIIPQETIPATGHTVIEDEGFPATCTHDGLTDGSHCSVCGEILAEQVVIPAAGHRPVIDKAVTPTCMHDGRSSGSHCMVCGFVFVPQKQIPKLDHTLVVDRPSKDPTCTETGFTRACHCIICGEMFSSREIPALGHIYEMVDETPANRIHAGLTEGVRCSRCSEWLIEQEIIPMIDDELDCGDLNDDGAVNINDVTLVQQMLTKKIEFIHKQLVAADANLDGIVDIRDATIIQKHIAKYLDLCMNKDAYIGVISNETEITPDFNVPYLYSSETELSIYPQSLFNKRFIDAGDPDAAFSKQNGHEGFSVANVDDLPQKTEVEIADGAKVLFIGDSYTAHNVYPKYVYDTITSLGKELTLLGTWGTGVYRNEGRSGWRNYTFAKCANQRDDPALADGLSIPNPFYNPEKGEFDFGWYVEKKLNNVSPDIVFVNLGTNDMSRGDFDSEEEILEYVSIIVSSIKAFNPDIKVVYWLPAQLPIGTNSGYDRWQGVTKYSRILIKNQSALQIDELCPVRYSFDCYHDGRFLSKDVEGKTIIYLNDKTHPSDSGYEHIGQMIIPYIHA